MSLTIDEVREFITDYPVNNYLIDGEEMSDTYINMCIGLALDSFNNMAPRSSYSSDSMPSKSVLLYGTCWHMYNGKSVLLARNTMNYSDGGLQVPLEERSQLYAGLASSFREQFVDQAKQLKIQINMEGGWGSVGSDESRFPLW